MMKVSLVSNKNLLFITYFNSNLHRVKTNFCCKNLNIYIEIIMSSEYIYSFDEKEEIYCNVTQKYSLFTFPTNAIRVECSPRREKS